MYILISLTGWVDSHYQENPYYTSVAKITNEQGYDQMLGKVARCWREEPVVYGPVWSLICKGLTSLSFGNIDIALLIFKLASLAMYIGSIYLIYRITKKKLFMLLFALNPVVLFDGLSNVHNDLFLVFFILLALYFVLKRKKLSLAVAAIAIATGIKYLSILLLPFLILYRLRKEKVWVRVGKALLYGLEFISILAIGYAVYVRDFNVFAGIFLQQNKYARSLFLGIWYLLKGNTNSIDILKNGLLLLFIASYSIIVLRLLFTKDEKKLCFVPLIRTYQLFLWIFTFILITNFNSWYIMWLLPTMFWQKGRQIKMTTYISIGSILAYAISYATMKDDETVGIPYFIFMIGIAILLYYVSMRTRSQWTKMSIGDRD